MPRLLSNRKPVARPGDLKENRWDYLNLQQAQPALGLAPEANTGFTLETDENGKVTYTNTLGRLEFDNQVISSTLEGENIEINSGINGGEIVLTPFQTARVAGNLSVEGDAIVDGDFTVRGVPYGTAPLVSNTLYVTPDGNDENDGTSMDATRACRTISGAVRSPFYQPGTAIKVMAGTYFEDNPIPLKPYTSVVGNDLRTTFVEPLNKDLDLFHVNSGVYIAQMQMRNLRRGAVERYAPGGAGTYTTGAYCVAFPPNLENPIDVYYSPYVQNCTNQSGPWLKDGTMMVPNQTIQIPLAAGTSTWTAGADQITVTLYTGTVVVGMALNDAANEGYRNAQLLLKRNREFLQKQTIAYVEDAFPDLVYDQAKCYRDVGYIVDAVAGDARFGGNKRSIEAGLAYWSGNNTLIPGEQSETISAIGYLRDISLQVITNTTVTNIYNTLSNQVIDLNLDNGSVVYTRASNSFNLITDIIANGESSAPDTPTPDLLGLIYPTGLSPNDVNVATTVTDVTQLSTNTYLITLSTSTVSPSDNATIYFGYTTTYPYLDADVPPEWSSNDREGFVDRRLDPIGSGGGALVDGNAPSLRSPIQSFVFDAFTQLNQGGIGIHIINNGYAQLVSVFTIMCSQAVIVENGGIASITNSNANFGDTCLTAKGLGKLAFQGFVVNPAYPTNVPNGEYYPLGYWPQKQVMEVFIPSDRDRPHIGQVMEVVPPDTYLNYEGERVPFINEAGYPGYLIATVNTNTITTSSYIINDVDVTGVSVGHTLYVRDIFGNEVHPDTGVPYVTTGTQVVDVNYRQIILDRPILSGYSDLTNPNFFNLYFCGNAYYTVLSSNIDTSLASTVTTEVTLVAGQETTTSLAVSYAKKLALRVIQNDPIDGFVYDQAKCRRDTGLIVDAIALDLLYPTPELSQSNFAGLQYWNQENYVGTIENEITTTTNAVRYVKELAMEVVQGITTGTRYQSTVTQNTGLPLATSIEADLVSNDFDAIIEILIDGVAGVTDKIIPNGEQSADENLARAYSLLVANRAYIQAEAVAFVEYTKTLGFTYDSAKCYRDVGYMVDSVAFDLLHPNGDIPSNKQAIQSGVYYYGYISTSTSIVGEIPQTTAAYNYIKDLVPYIVKGITTSTYQSYVEQVTDLDPGTDDEVLVIQSYIDHITNIINVGPAAAEVKVPISLTESVDPDVYNAYRMLNANRAFIQESVIAYINETYESGAYQSVYNQVFDETLSGGSDAVTSLGEKFDIISGIIINGADSSPEIVRPRQYVDSNQNILNAKKLLDKNKLFIQAETVAFVDSIWPSKFSYDPVKCSRDTGLIVDSLAQDLLFDGTSQSTFAGIQYWNQGLTVIPGEQTTTTRAVSYLKELAQKIVKNDTSGYRYSFSYDQTKCARDTGLIVDALAQDLLFDGTSQSTFAGIQYWNQDSYVGSIENELTTTTNAIEYVSYLAQRVVQNITTGTRYQSTVTQDTSLTAATISEAAVIETEFNIITDILSTGTVGVTDKIVPNEIFESSDVDVNRAYDLLLANKAYIQAEAIAFVESTKTLGFDYDQTKCYRDVGYMIDSVAFDLLYGGNKQAYQSGVYYYGYNETSTAVPNEIPQVTAAYNYIKQMVPFVVQGINTATYQSAVSQVTTLTTATIVEASAIQANIDLITNIIINGPDEVTALEKQPIGLVASSTSSIVAAATILNANREFITAETIAYINEVFKGSPLQVTSVNTASTSQASVIGAEFDVILDILANGTDGITDKIVPNGLDQIAASQNVYNLLQSNKGYLQGEVVAYVDYTSKFEYDQVKCARDTGLIVDSIALDLLYPTATDSQSNFAGLQYWNQSNYVGSIASEITTTTNAITHISSIAQKIVVNDKSGTRYQNTVTQTTSTLVGSVGDAVTVGTDFGVILDILANGTAGVTDIIVPNGRRSITTATINAYNLLVSNRDYLVAEAIAFVESTKTVGFEYDQTKCARDVGYMVDSVAFDLLHGGNKQAIQSGVLYYGYNSSSTAVPNEIPQVTAAYNRIKEILTSILAGIEIVPSAGNETKQVTYMLPASSSVISSARSKIDKITNIINNGPSAASALIPISLTPSTDANADRAYDLLMANRQFITDEVIAYINNTFTGFDYDKAKCYRDVGYMVDSVSFDILYGGNKQAIQSGVYYYGYDGDSTAIVGEIPQTTSAYNFIERIVGDIVTGTLIANPQQSSVPQVTNLSFTYNQDKCSRDTGILVDSFVTDLLFNENGYTQSNFSGLQYWNQNGYTGSIASEITTTTNAIRFLRSLAEQVVINGTSTATVVRYTTTASQVTNLTTATYDQLYRVRKDFNLIVDILTTGTSGITDKVEANGINIVSEDAENAYNLLIANKQYLQEQIIAYVESTKTSGFEYDMSKCYRDVGYIVDSVAFDIKYGGNRQAIQSGVYYYGFSTSTSAIAGEIEQTIAAYTRLKEILPDIVTNTSIVKSPNNTLTQVTNLTTATSAEGLELENMVDLITGIITTGPTAAEVQLPVSLNQSTATSVVAAAEILAANRDFIVSEVVNYLNYVFLVGTDAEAQAIKNNVNLINNIIEYGPDEVTIKEPIALTRSTSTSVVNAAKLLSANRDFIRAETIAYINNTYNTGFLYDKSKCRRDTGLIVDSIAFDLLYEGTTESTFAGLQYWNQDSYTGTIKGEITTTTNAIRYLKELVQDAVLNNTISVTTGNIYTQVTNLTTSTQGVAEILAGNVDVILDIITNGTNGVTDIIVPNGVASTSADITNAVDILQANKSFIQNEVVARINLDNSEFEYDRATCSRDVGYIIDSLSFDLLHGGNRQSVTSGVYYYGFNAADTVIDDQVPQTTAAYNYIRELVDKVVRGISVPTPYQKKVAQVISANVGTTTEVDLARDKIDNITNIINNGPSEAPVKQPISLTASTSEEVINAFNLLIANRAFIQAEVISYIDAVFTDATNYNKEKCFRDMGAIVDAVGYDLIYGGNYNSVNTGNGYFLRKGQYHLVRLEQNVTDPTLFIDGATVRFYQQSYISASGYLFEYVGAGTQYGALPQVGTADPTQSKEVVQLNNGKVFFTSTDQNGDFRIGPTLVISQSTGILSGRTFQKSLYAEMTPFILVVGA